MLIGFEHEWRKEFKRLDGAYAPSTMRSYYTDVELFVDWCMEHSLCPFPASIQTVCLFLDSQAATRAISTIRRRLYAIRKIHRLMRLADPTWDEEINLTFRRIRRKKRARPRQAKGMTRVYLERFLAVQPDSPLGLRNRTMLSLGYDLLTRRAELVALTLPDIEFRAGGTLSALIRRSKADPHGLGRVAFTSRRTAALVREWLDWRGDAIDYLFCPVYHGVAVDRALSTCTVKRVVKEAASAAGLSHDEIADFSGHSMRVGAAQDLLCAGHDTAAIMRAGGWKSVNVLARYLEYAEHNVWA